MSEIYRGQETATPDNLVDQLSQAVQRKDRVEVLRLAQGEHPADTAHAMAHLEFPLFLKAFRTVLLSDLELAAEVLVELDNKLIAHLIPHLNYQEWAWVFGECSDDDMVFLLDLFPEEDRDKLLAQLSSQDKRDVMERMTYPEESAGRIMTSEYIAMERDATVALAVENIRRHRDFDPTNLLFIYVTENERVVGVVSMRQLLLNKANRRLDAIMTTDFTPIHADTDQEEVAIRMRQHDDVTVPVVDDHGQILGIITVDDVLDVINEESEEDLYKQIGSSDEELLAGDNFRRIVALRLPWILASFFGSLMVALVMRFAEQDVFGAQAAQLFVFVPMICAMGGNVGVQSSTIMARFLSTRSMDARATRRSTVKEAKVGLSLGIICGGLIGTIAFVWGGWPLLVTVVTAMICAMTGAATTGTIIPIAMKRFGFDPALATGPFVTSFNDLVATCVYFSIAFLFVDSMVL